MNTDDVMDFLRQTVASAPDLASDVAEEAKQKPKRRRCWLFPGFDFGFIWELGNSKAETKAAPLLIRKAEGDEGAASPKAPRARARASKAKAKAEEQEGAADKGIKEEGHPVKAPADGDDGDAGLGRAHVMDQVQAGGVVCVAGLAANCRCAVYAGAVHAEQSKDLQQETTAGVAAKPGMQMQMPQLPCS